MQVIQSMLAVLLLLTALVTQTVNGTPALETQGLALHPDSCAIAFSQEQQPSDTVAITTATSKRKRDDNDNQDNAEQQKTCSCCQQIKPLTEFNKDKSQKNGYMLFCRTCQKTKQQKCQDQECSKQPAFGLIWKKPTHCKTHKTAVMTNVKNKRCLACNKIPSYGTKIGKPLCCAEHKTLEMYDVKHAKCKFEGCRTIPIFGTDKAEFCVIHKTDDMVDLVNKRCKTANCNRLPFYAMQGNKAEWCSTHAEEGMINVMSKRCEECDIFACYGFPGITRTKCATHKLPGMLLLKNLRCIQQGCSNICTHGIGFAKWCEQHALHTHQNLVERVCSSCDLVQILNQDNKCEYCSEQLSEPEKVHLKKQKELQAYLDADADMSGYDFTDRRVKIEQDVQCSTTSRPDFVYDMGTHAVVVENDEFQHRGNSYQCEQVRMRQIAEDIMRPIVFIRFNCDSFKVEGVPQKVNMDTKIAELKKWLMYSFNPENVAGVVNVVYLFYDEFKAEEVKMQVLVQKFS